MPDEVIDAIAAYLRESNANVGGPFETSRGPRRVVDAAREARGRLPRLRGRRGDRSAPNMTTLNFALSRTARPRASSRATRSSSRASTTTPTSRPGSSSRTTAASIVRFADITRRLRRSTSTTSSGSSTARTRVVAFPVASNAVGTLAGRPRASRSSRTRPARSPGWTPSTTRRTGRSTSPRWASTCSSARRTSSSARTSGVAFGRRELARALAAVQGAARPPTSRSAHRFETGTLPHELLAGFVAAVEYLESIGWDAIAGARARARRALPRRPARRLRRCTACRRWTAACRRSRSTSTALAADEVGGAARRARHRGLARATTTRSRCMRRLGPRGRGAVRAGFVHYNTADEVDRLLEALAASVSAVARPGRAAARPASLRHDEPSGRRARVHRARPRAADGRRGGERALRAHPDRPNLVARLGGENGGAPLLLYGHVDVVPTAGQQWTHPPFARRGRRRHGLGPGRTRHEVAAWR